MLVEEEHVLDEHQPSTLCNRAEETIQDTCSLKIGVVRCCCAIYSTCDSKQQKVERRRISSKVIVTNNGTGSASALDMEIKFDNLFVPLEEDTTHLT